MRILFRITTGCLAIFATIFMMVASQVSQPLAGKRPARVTGSLHPFSSVPDTLIVLHDDKFTPDQLVTIQSLQGLLAKEKPVIYRIRGGSYKLWLKDLIDNYNVTADTTFDGDFKGILERYGHLLPGYILCDLHQPSANVAFSLSGISGTLAVTTACEADITELGIPLLHDVRNRDERWAFEQFGKSFNTDIMVYQKKEKDLFLGDYSVFAGAFHFFDHINSELTSKAFSTLNNNGVLLGWGEGEHPTVLGASSHSLYMYPADWALNLSTFTNFQTTELKQHAHSQKPTRVKDVHTVCFLMSDGDNLQWLLGGFCNSSHWFGSNNRGKVDIGWTISPALSELAPTVMSYIYRHAANTPQGKDYFVAGPSGLGYIFPDHFPAIDKAATLLNRFMDKSDLNIVNIISDNFQEESLLSYLKQPNIDALFYYPYSHYSGWKGEICWVNDKPVIGGRYNLWKGFESTKSLAAKLNREARDPSISAGYSLIPVHAWSNNVDSILKVVDALNEQVEVVAPDEFVNRIMTNVVRTK